MTAIKYLSAFRLYGADVLLLALGVTLVTSLIKKTVMKNCSKKAYVFLPFALGIVFYAAYRMIAEKSFVSVFTDLSTVEGGFACGCAATLYYVIYEQFFRANGESVSALSPLLEGYIPEENVSAAAEELLGGVGKTGEELTAFVEETLRRYADPISEAELELLVKLVSEYLATITQ